jgi:hypothetical protein
MININNSFKIFLLLNIVYLIFSQNIFQEFSPYWNVSTINNELYYLFRVFYIIAMTSSVVITGSNFITIFSFAFSSNLSTISWLISSFIFGNSIWQIFIFFIGVFNYLNIYIIDIFILFNIFLFYYLKTNVSIYKLKNFFSSNNFDIFLLIFLLFLILLIWQLNCQFPLDGDFLTHYGQYYLRVRDNQSLMPNDVWYHFFYSKADGLQIAAVIMTDISGILLISFIYLVFTCLIFYNVLKQLFSSQRLAITTIIIALFIICLDTLPSDITHVATGAFEKHHLGVLFSLASLMFCLNEIVMKQTNKNNNTMNLFGILCSLQSLVFISTPAVIYGIGSLCGMCLLLFTCNTLKKRQVLNILFIVCLGVCLTILMMLFNWKSTGLFEITPFRTFFNFANFEKLSQWISPYLALYLDLGTSKDLGNFSLQISDLFKHLIFILRLNLLERFFPLIITAFLFICCLLHIFKNRTSIGREHSPIIFILLICLLTYLSFIGVTQPHSVYRSTAFVSFFVSSILVCGMLFIKECVYGPLKKYFYKS